MRGRNDELARAQTETLEALRLRAVDLARQYQNGLDDNTRRALRDLSGWITEHSVKFEERRTRTKVSVTRLRLLSLQLEKVLEQLAASRSGPQQTRLCSKLDELVDGQQRRDLYDDMIACLKELANLCVERGQGRQAVLYNEMGQRLETRLETGHIDLNNDTQRANDEALYADFQQKLKAMKE